MTAAWLRRAYPSALLILAVALWGRWWIGPAHPQGTNGIATGAFLAADMRVVCSAECQSSEADRLRMMLRQCMPGTNRVELGNGETLALYQMDFSAPVLPQPPPAAR